VAKIRSTSSNLTTHDPFLPKVYLLSSFHHDSSLCLADKHEFFFSAAAAE
jgi:hypothetical protein